MLPAAPTLPFPRDTKWPAQVAGRPLHCYYDWLTLNAAITLTGCPAATVPCAILDASVLCSAGIQPPSKIDLGVNRIPCDDEAFELPVAVQIVGPPGHDARVLAAAAALEAACASVRVPRCIAKAARAERCVCGAPGCPAAVRLALSAGATAKLLEEAAAAARPRRAIHAWQAASIEPFLLPPDLRRHSYAAITSFTSHHAHLPHRSALRLISASFSTTRVAAGVGASAASAAGAAGAGAGAADADGADALAQLAPGDLAAARSLSFMLSRAPSMEAVLALRDPVESLLRLEEDSQW